MRRRREILSLGLLSLGLLGLVWYLSARSPSLAAMDADPLARIPEYPDRLQPVSASPRDTDRTRSPALEQTATYPLIFPDGAELPVSLRPFPWVEVELLDDVATRYGPLSRAAQEGDGLAAYTLGENLRHCEEWGYRSEQALSQAMDDLRSNHAFTDPNGNVVSVSPGLDGNVDVVHYSTILKTTTLRCSGVPEEWRSEWREWLDVAAARGIVMGALNFAISSSRDEEGLAAYERLWSLGSHIGLEFMGAAYAQGWGDMTPDPVKAYAYTLLYLNILQAAYADQEGVVAPYFWTVLRTSPIHEFAEHLTHPQAAQATALAKRTLRDNPRCCVGLRMAESSVTSQGQQVIDH